MLAGSAFAAAKPAVSVGQIKAYAAPALSFDSLEVRLLPSVHSGDGLLANNGWLAEAPDPMSKTVWENVILVSPKLGKELGIDPKGSLIQVARKELANRGLDKQGQWVGFDKANQIHNA